MISKQKGPIKSNVPSGKQLSVAQKNKEQGKRNSCMKDFQTPLLKEPKK